jgi:hypothetical protein
MFEKFNKEDKFGNKIVCSEKGNIYLYLTTGKKRNIGKLKYKENKIIYGNYILNYLNEENYENI